MSSSDSTSQSSSVGSSDALNLPLNSSASTLNSTADRSSPDGLPHGNDMKSETNSLPPTLEAPAQPALSESDAALKEEELRTKVKEWKEKRDAAMKKESDLYKIQPHAVHTIARYSGHDIIDVNLQENQKFAEWVKVKDVLFKETHEYQASLYHAERDLLLAEIRHLEAKDATYARSSNPNRQELDNHSCVLSTLRAKNVLLTKNKADVDHQDAFMLTIGKPNRNLTYCM